MAVFFDAKIQTPFPGIFGLTEWHRTHALLAIASYNEKEGSAVSVYQKEGSPVSGSVVRRPRPATSLAWHPSMPTLVCGWETGEVTVHSLHENESAWSSAFRIDVCIAPPAHQNAITVITWSTGGTRLLTGDAAGSLVLWKADSAGGIQSEPICNCRACGRIAHVILKEAETPGPAVDVQPAAAARNAASKTKDDALDLLPWKKHVGMVGTKDSASKKLNPVTFLIAVEEGETGTVAILNEHTNLITQFITDGHIIKMFSCDGLVTLTNKLTLMMHCYGHDGTLTEKLKVKLCGNAVNVDMIFAGHGQIATCNGTDCIRLWNLEAGDSDVLSISKQDGQDECKEDRHITCLAYHAKRGILAGGTVSGNVVMWYYGFAGKQCFQPCDPWKLEPPATFMRPVLNLSWCPTQTLLLVNFGDELLLLTEHTKCLHCCHETIAIQTGPMHLAVAVINADENTVSEANLKTEIQIWGVAVAKGVIAVWDFNTVAVYDGGPGSFKLVGKFAAVSTLSVCLFDSNVYTIEPSKVHVRNRQGVIKQIISSVLDVEGWFDHMEICSHFLVISTSQNIVKIYDLSRSRNAKALCPPKVFDVDGRIVSAKCNSIGSIVSFTIKKNGNVGSMLYVWDVELDVVQFFDFATGKNNLFFNDTLLNREHLDRCPCRVFENISERFPVRHFWDHEDPRLLVCEARINYSEGISDNSHKNSLKQIQRPDVAVIVSLFATTDYGLLVQDSFGLDFALGELVSLQLPFYYFTRDYFTDDEWNEDKLDKSTWSSVLKMSHTDRKAKADRSCTDFIVRRVHRDFICLEDADKITRQTIVNFSYFLTTGLMDEAFRAIHSIKSKSVWENMARMCVKSGRLDVIRVCLGNMSNARVAMALRQSNQLNNTDAQLATLAIHLGMLDEAERLLRKCQRYDLLISMFENQGQWQKSIETAATHCRVHLRTARHNYAKSLESDGNFITASSQYQLAGTHRTQVPRMLYYRQSLKDLTEYVDDKRDPEINKWYASYMSSIGKYDVAINYFAAAGDSLNQIKIHCMTNNTTEAINLCTTTNDKAACCYLAREFMKVDRINEAINLYTRAEAYGSAMRLCKKLGLDQKVLHLANLAKPQDQIEAAKYLQEQIGSEYEAITLYHKAGYVNQALQLAFNINHFHAVQRISQTLSADENPQLFLTVAEYFISNSQFDRAVSILARAKQYQAAIKICRTHHVPMTQEIVESLCQTRSSDEDHNQLIEIVEAVGEVCFEQAQYHLATKMFTQAGNRIKAMRALLKSGDTEKIIYFASVSRDKEIYVMAANYLQSLDWMDNVDFSEKIISFYKKGGAIEALANFYISCSEIEIDDRRCYERALQALQQAYDLLLKIDTENGRRQIDVINNHMVLIKSFIDAIGSCNSSILWETKDAVQTIINLLDVPNIDETIRLADIFGFLVDHYVRMKDMVEASEYLKHMKKYVQRSKMEKYLELQTRQALQAHLLGPLTALDRGDHGLGDNENTELKVGECDDDNGEEEISEEESCTIVNDC